MRRRILLGDNRGGGAVTLQPIRFQCVGVWIYIYIYRERERERQSQRGTERDRERV